MWRGERKARLYLPFGHVIGWTKACKANEKQGSINLLDTLLDGLRRGEASEKRGSVYAVAS